jgi:hypothetical protein
VETLLPCRAGKSVKKPEVFSKTKQDSTPSAATQEAIFMKKGVQCLGSAT